jgi:CBS domain containing-hemolysin-like protein
MVEEMFVTFGKTRQERWARAAVMVLCLLVLVFSFAAKLSLYQPKSTQIKALASSKMWQHEAQAAAAVMSAPDEQSATMVPVLSALMLMLLISLAMFQRLEREIAPAVQRGDFASNSQLRAPPVR